MRALVLVPVLKQAKAQPLPEGAPPAPSRSNEARLEEAIGLARAIDLTIVQTFHHHHIYFYMKVAIDQQLNIIHHSLKLISSCKMLKSGSL